MHFSIWEKVGFGVLCAGWLIYATNVIGNVLVQPKDPGDKGMKVEVAESEAPAEAAAAEAPAKSAIELMASADADAGAKVFKKCTSCHSSEAGAKHKIGPNLWGVVGRKQGGAEGFNFSGALSDLGGTWTVEELDKFLESPKAYAKGNKMSFRGISKPEQRAALLVYLGTLQ